MAFFSRPYIGLARAYSQLKQHDDALTAAKRGVELEPNLYAYWALGDVYVARKQYDEAVAAYRKAAENDPKSPDICMALGRAFYAKQDYGSAVEAFTRASELAPNNPLALSWLGATRARAGQFDEAIAAIDKAIGMVTVVGIGVRISMENGSPVLQRQVEDEPELVDGPAKEAGLQAGDTLIKIDGQPTKGWDVDKTIQNLRGEENTPVVLTVQRPGEAKPFERTIVRKRIIPKTATAYYGSRSLYARENGNRKAAARDAELAYSLDPDNVSAREALAVLNIDDGKHQEAVRLLSSLKDNSYARILEATAQARQGDVKQAVAIYTNIPEADLGETPLRRNAGRALLQTLEGYVKEKLEKAGAAESAGRFVEAMAEYAEAVKIADEATAGSIRQRVGALLKANPYLAELPEEARKYALRGDVLIKEGAFADALAEYRKAVKLAPFNPQLYFNTALICGQLQDCREAITFMNVYLQLSPDAPNARAAKDEIYKWEFQLEKEGKK